MKEDDMGWECDRHEGDKNAYKIVVGKLLATFYARFKKTVKIEVLNILMFTF